MTIDHCLAAPMLLVASLLFVPAAGAQDASTYYTVTHPTEFKTNWTAFYAQADALTAATRTEVRHELDLSYGGDPKQRLDLYFPKDAPANAPVFLFFHGGGFREGDRAQYGYVAKPFAAHGIITAVASYRLTGQGFKYPAQRDDARLAAAWLFKHIGRYGGDPRRIFIGGHSSGAIMVADLGMDRAWMRSAGMPKPALRGIVPVSGPYDLRTPEHPGEQQVFWSGYTPTEAERAAASPLLHIGDPVPAAYIAAGALEHEGYDDYVSSSAAFAAALTAHGSHTQVFDMPGAGHRDTVFALGDPDTELSKAVLAFIDTH
jgi:acetyl esterase/lipase